MDRKKTLAGDLFNGVARDLPEGWQLGILLEKSSGTVQLLDPEGDELSFPTNYECLVEEVYDALEYAIAVEKDEEK